MRARATSAHEIPAREPIRLEPGHQVEVGEPDSQWPAFVFVTGPTGQGWVPSRHLSADAGTAVVVTPYDTTELSLEAGEVVDVLDRDDESGWWWCRRGDGAQGWVPVSALEPEK
ncbi:MAG TPA: SH3 domain-containing protein [Acidimicrobiia bacterium]